MLIPFSSPRGPLPMPISIAMNMQLLLLCRTLDECSRGSTLRPNKHTVLHNEFPNYNRINYGAVAGDTATHKPVQDG